jgi:orotate phosphoribosyltransferase
MNREFAVAEKLLQINAVKLNLQNPFTWASGWKSPIYCDEKFSPILMSETLLKVK